LKLEIIDRDDHQKQVIAEIDNESFERFKHQAARKISKEIRVPGFRPGKAPYDVIRRVAGDKAIQDEAVELMLKEIYPKILEEAHIDPYGPGKIDEILSLDPPKFSFIIPLNPSVELGNYKEIRREYNEPVITDEKVEEVIERLRRRMGVAIPVERPSQPGDLVAIKMSARLLNPQEGEEAVLIEENTFEMVAGMPEDHTDEEGNEWPFPGFVNELVGLQPGEKKTILHTFPEDDSDDDLSGKEAEFIIEVESVKEIQKPQLDDDFAKTVGGFETVENLRKVIRNQLQDNETSKYNQEYFQALIEELVNGATVQYPPVALEEEIEHVLSHFLQDLQQEKMDFDTYLKTRELSREEFIEKEIKPVAERRLKRDLVLEEFATRENLRFQPEELVSIYNMAREQVRSNDMLRTLRKEKMDTRTLTDTLARSTINELFNQRLTSRLRAIATGQTEVAQTTAQSESAETATDEQPAASPEPDSSGSDQATPDVESNISESTVQE